ncbi:hypothetical protein [Staphylococcus epidermidis]|uniref:hypothetical protein n=1 Tax=Staphylococcus epidermidis TaxID=1282 RepID=UPI0011AA9552|nr:hypothetical protein [Staphylococcus epidermidis]
MEEMKWGVGYRRGGLWREVGCNYNIVKVFIKVRMYKCFVRWISVLSMNKGIGFNIKGIGIVKKKIVEIVKRNCKRKWKEFLKMGNIL